jgi:glycogen debranching enzyme
VGGLDQEKKNCLWDLGLSTIKSLETTDGILASGREEIFGCIFGRDSLITSLKLLTVYEKTQDEYFLQLVRKILFNLGTLQGKELTIESGEEPGKCIHEYRPANHEHLTQALLEPWYVYPDMSMRNYDSVDSTPLFLIALHRYFELSGDRIFIDDMLPHIEAALGWLLEYADSNGDAFVDYRFHHDRKHGGLRVQNWMDSSESLFHEDGSDVVYPIAPVEVQAYAYLALRVWSNYFLQTFQEYGEALFLRSQVLRSNFNQVFILEQSKDSFNMAAAIDGNGKPLVSVRSSIGHCLWASYLWGGKRECIVDEKYIPHIVRRVLSNDLFEPDAGIRTLSTLSKNYHSNSYHNGSIWPHDSSIIAEGMERFGYNDEARSVRSGLLSAISHFQTPIELFVYDSDGYREYTSPSGQKACREQAWCAATILKEVSFIN